MVDTVFGKYRGFLAQRHMLGSHVRLRSVGHDIWLHQRSINFVRAVDGELGHPGEGR